MKTNWKSIIEAQNSKVYVLPPGWDSKADVAEALGCSEDRVRILMAPGLKDRSVEKKDFQIWDKIGKRITRITAYRYLKPCVKQ